MDIKIAIIEPIMDAIKFSMFTDNSRNRWKVSTLSPYRISRFSTYCNIMPKKWKPQFYKKSNQL